MREFGHDQDLAVAQSKLLRTRFLQAFITNLPSFCCTPNSKLRNKEANAVYSYMIIVKY